MVVWRTHSRSKLFYFFKDQTRFYSEEYDIKNNWHYAISGDLITNSIIT
ncbi:unnamed protein product, partial [marine sediment metagenome]